MLLLFLVACSNNDENADQNQSEQEKEPVTEEEQDKTESEQEQYHEPITVEDFPNAFLEGNFEAIYNQMSEEFKNMVTFDQFKVLGIDFNQNVQGFKLISEMPYQNVTEYQWLSDQGDKGIRGHFSDDLTIHGLQLMLISSHPETDKEYTQNTYQMPFKGEWFTFWGGTNELVNYHYALENQRYAYDLMIVKDGYSFDGDPTDNESYFVYGKDVIAPNGGVVVSVENGIEDNTPTVDTNAENPLGNHVIIEHDHNEYSVIAHLRPGSLEVTEGDVVETGDLLGQVGNSGNSSEPHIHFHAADGPNWAEATSIRIKFEGDKNPVRGDSVIGFEE